MWLLLALACTYGPTVDRSEFGNAVLHEDGNRCVFTQRVFQYRPATGLAAFPDGGVPRYDVDRRRIGIHDIHRNTTTVLVDEPNTTWQPGQGGFHVHGVRGRHGLVRQGGHLPSGEVVGRWLDLQLEDGTLTEVPLQTELARHDLTLRHPELVGPGFALVLTATTSSGLQQLWHRNEDGELRHLATTQQVLGVHEGELWWYDPDRRAGARTDLETGETVYEDRADFALPEVEPTEECQGSGRHLLFNHRLGERWEADIVLTVDDVRGPRPVFGE